MPYDILACAPRKGTSAAQLGPHLGPLTKIERAGSSKPEKDIPGNKNITFSCTSLKEEYQQGFGGLGFHLIAGWPRGAAARPAGAARPFIQSKSVQSRYNPLNPDFREGLRFDLCSPKIPPLHDTLPCVLTPTPY